MEIFFLVVVPLVKVPQSLVARPFDLSESQIWPHCSYPNLQTLA